ncbi:DarT ssDNA thymidine ADP-ribosyltransferase family protein [Nocardia xishanensis]|uniref:DarT ssDNA thymidine ADP-ribosyltransferase family protein n=1 Tax=Nocardia xishanensis TaxID=238964 RepID=UPI0008335950|nr:DarT ssDNA thymidine ADP-ribosyltransferase family protein [Nocardia xishanensis]
MTLLDAEVLAELRSMPLERLAHFTPARNLRHILADGELRSAAELRDDVRACFTETDLERLDGHPDRVCCSFQYPNAYYLSVAKSKPNAVSYPDWVCFLIDKEIAARHGTLFCARNAAAGGAAPGVEALRRCYAASVSGQGNRVRTRGANHDPRCPTDVQAELLVPGPIPLSAVRAIVFPSADAAEEEYGRVQRIGITSVPKSIPSLVSLGLFDKQLVSAAVTTSSRLEETVWRPVAGGQP